MNMELSPFIKGAITAFIFCTAYHFLPKKIQGIKRYAIAIIITVLIRLLILYIIDL